MERFLENIVCAFRWLLAPVYFGLSLALVALALKFFREIIHVLPNTSSMAESDLILILLSLVDMTLADDLLMMVIFSGYENFVSRLDISEDKEKLGWLGKMGATSLKNKVAASIVAVSSTHLLHVFMDAKNIPNNRLMWYVIIHPMFVLSAFMMGYLDRLTRYNHWSDSSAVHTPVINRSFIGRRLPQIQLVIGGMLINLRQLLSAKCQIIQRLHVLL